MSQRAGEAIKRTGFDAFGHFFKNDQELFISEARKQFPRSDADIVGMFIRSSAELAAGNYKDAIKYLESSPFCDNCAGLIYSYFQVGHTELAEQLLKQRKEQYRTDLEAGVRYTYGSPSVIPMGFEAMDLALLEGDIDKAIQHLQTAIRNGVPLTSEIRHWHMYQQLRNHPKWPSIRDTNDKRMAEQRDIYLKLVAEQDEFSTAS